MTTPRKQNIITTIAAYSKPLFGFILNRVPDRAEAEDILQEVFYQFIKNPDPIREISAWLYKVARNKITDRYRKNHPLFLEELLQVKGENNPAFLKGMNLIADHNSDPESVFLRSLFWKTLNEALDELPAKQKLAFTLHELEQLSYKEIADMTGETVNTLISRKHYAVLHLRKRLKNLRDEILLH